MRKYIRNAKFLGLALFSIIATVSCEVGLGASVDTERPKLEITYPPKGSIVMGTFSLAGTVSDDIGVSFVNVTLTHKTLKTEYVYKSEDGDVTVENPSGGWSKGTKWTASIGKHDGSQVLYNGWDLPDGDYFIDVEANDGVGSVYDRRSIRIDNTAPVFISDNITSLEATDEKKVSKFGQKINLKGSAKDESDISKVFFDVYDENKNFLGSKSMDYDMTSDGILLARYSSVIPSSQSEKVLAENYNLIYGLSENESLPDVFNDADKKNRFILIRFADKARVYNTPVYVNEDSAGVTGFEGQGEGNISSELFLNTTDFGIEEITVDELSEYKKHLSKNEVMDAKLAKVSANSVANTSGLSGNNFNKINKIKVDPEINPKWSIDSFDQTNDDFNLAYLDSTTSLNVIFAAGNDGTTFLPEKICILLERIEETAPNSRTYTKRVKTDEEIKAWAENWTDNSKDTNDLIMLKEFGKTQDGSSGKLVDSYYYEVLLDSPKLIVPNRYRVVVLGKDGSTGEGNDFFEDNKGWYGFQATKQASAPEIKFKKDDKWVDAKLAEGEWLGPDTESYTLEFQITTAGEDLALENPVVSYTVVNSSNGGIVDNAQGKYTWNKIKNPMPQERDRQSSNYEYKWELKSAEGGNLWMPDEDGDYKIVITVEAEDKSEGFASVSYKLNIDRTPPSVTVRETSPYIEGGIINGTVKIPVSFKDSKGISKAEYSIKWDSPVPESDKIDLDFDNAGEIVLDTVGKVSDKTPVVLEVSATDIYGNKKTEKVNYIVDQESDKPVIELNLEETGTVSEQWEKNSLGLSSGNLITGTVKDDDGIIDSSCLKVKVWGIGENGSEALVSDWKTITLENGRFTWDYYKTGVITKDGKYKLQFEATDKVGNLATSKALTSQINILVDGTAPLFDEVAVVKIDGITQTKDGGKYYVSAGKTADITFKVEEGNLKSLKAGETELKGTASCVHPEGSVTDWNVKYTWAPEDAETSGEKILKITALDDSGNTKEKELKFYYDKDLPVLSDMDLKISPVLEGDIVNGQIFVEGKVSDNDKVSKVKGTVIYKDKTDGTEKTAELFNVNTAVFGKTDVITVNTQDFKDNTEFKIKFDFTDRAGNSDTVTKIFNIDQSSDKPRIEVNLGNTGDYSENNFKLTSVNQISVSVKDDDGVNDASGLKVKVWKVGADNTETVVSDWNTVSLEKGKVLWNFYDSEAIVENGKYKIQFEATDKIGNLSTSKTESEKYAILVDGTAPVFEEEVSVNVNGTSLTKESGKYYVPKNKDVVFSFKVSEENLKSLKIGETELKGTAACSRVSESVTEWAVIYTWKPGSETAGDKQIVFTAEDISGNTRTKEIKFYYDTELPVVSEDELKIHPVINTNIVNGILYVEGRASDNDKISGITGTVNYTAKDGTSKSEEFFTSNGTTFGKTEIAKIDTTEFKDRTSITVKFTAFDRAGNPGSITKSFNIDQSTDKPVIAFDSSKFDTSLTSFSAVETANKNMFGLNTNNILSGTVSDDDGVGEVVITVEGTDKKAVFTGKTAFNCNLKDDLGIDAAGNYILKINATDDVNKTKLSSPNSAETKTLYIVVDGVAPAIQAEKIGAKAYTGNIPVNGNFTLSFDVNEAHLSQVSVQLNNDAAETLVRKSFNSETGISHFEKSITLSDEDKDSVLSIKITAEDLSGLSAEKELNVYYDATAPEINTTITRLLKGNKVNGNITISGTVKDEAGSGVASGTKVELFDSENNKVNKLVSEEANSDTSFTYSVNTNTSLTDGGIYTLKVTASDKAGNPAEKEIVFTVDQSTDKPTISFVNANIDAETDGISVFGSSGWTIDFAAEDDDGDVIVTANGVKVSSPYTIPEGDLRKSGTHTIDFVVKEAYEENLASPLSELYTLSFAVDTKSPEFISQVLNDATYFENMFVKGDFDIVFTVDDDNSIEKLEYKSGDNWVSTGISYSEDKKTITHSYSGQSTKDVTTDYRLTDVYGFVSTKTLKYKVDSASPSLESAVIELDDAAFDSDKWFNKESIKVSVSGVKDNNLNGTVSVTGDSAGEGESFVMTVENHVGSFSQTRSFSDGVKTVNYTFKDEAGNAVLLPVTLKVDTTPPSVSHIVSEGNTVAYISASGVVTGKEKVKVNFTASDGSGDSVSGLATAVLGPKAGFKDSEKYAAAINLSSSGTVEDKEIDFNAKEEGKHEIWVRVTDNVGNDSETKLGEFILDRTLPKVEYTSHSNNATVNKTITLKGTVKDDNLGENPTAVLKCGKSVTGSEVSVSGTGNNRTWSVELDTASFKNEDGTYVSGQKTFCLEVTDAAGNVSTDEISLNIDQDSDRPAIILDSIKTDGTTTLGSGKITGTVTDDDGISSFAIQVVRKSGDSFVNVVEENDGWKVVEPAVNGKFEYEIPVEEGNSVDGSYVVYFQIEDTAGTLFESTDNDRVSDLIKPRIYEKNGVTPVTIGVDFDVDGTSPVIDSIQVQVSSDNSNWGTAAPLATGVHYGGPKKRYAKLTITGSDNVLPTAQLNVSVSVNGISHSVSHDPASGFTYVIDFTSMDSGSVPVEVSIADNSDGIPALRQVSITCDNSAPSSSNAIANFTPVSDDEVTGVVAVSATVNDDNEANSGINNVKYYVPLKTQTIASESFSWSDTGLTITDIVMRLSLDGLSENTEIKDDYAGYEITSGQKIYQIPVWFRVEDNCGNVTYVTDKTIRYNPNAARPKIKRTYPVQNEVTLGGTIRMAGTAEDDVDIHSVYVQYDVDGDGFDNDDAIWLSGKDYKIFNVQSGEEIKTVNAGNLSGKTWGVKAEGTRSWNAEFDASALETNTPLKIRMLARDADQNTLVSAWTETLSVTVNNDLPQFSQFYLVQYDGSNNEIKRTPYETDKYVKGENWFLEGSVTDKNNIESVEQDKVALTTSTGLTAITKGYNLKLPVNPVGGKFSTILKATNANEQNKTPKEEMYSVNIDNDAPAFEDGSSANDLVLYAGEYGRNYLNSSTYMQNSNGFTMVSGKVNEPGSGFTRAVFYLERYSEKNTSGDTTTYKKRRLFNVMTGDEINLVDKDGNEVEGAPTFNADGLPVGAEIDITKGSDNISFTVEDGVLNNSIRIGGLVIIGNVYKKITAIDSSAKKVIVSEKIESAWTDNKQKAQFVYAFSVDKSDESRDESGNEKGGDGDGIVERITKQGSNYIWQASFDSSVIKDGPVELHVVVFDAAGNSRSGEVSTRISNNAPRITSVKLGTDLNHSGGVEESEYTQFYAYKNNWGEAVTDQGKDVWNLVPSRETESLGKNWKVVSGLNVIPEFVGGNGNIHYIFSKAVGTGDGKRLETAETGTATQFATINETTKKLDVSEIELDDDAIDSNGEDGINTFRFSFWDSTEESTPGTDSGSCVLNVELYQDITDGTDPTATVSPFFWNKRKAGNNSVAWDTTNVNKPLGHIELEADWRSAAYDYSEETQAYNIKSNYSSLDAKLKDLDPKVSGTIVIRGTAFDETVLSKLVVTFDGIIDGSNTKCESEYTASSGVWGGINTSGTGYSLTVTDSNGGVTQDGHSVNWELTLDTSKILGQTGLDKKVYVKAVDKAVSGNSRESAVAEYQMDIVPYVTEVVTSLSSLKTSNTSVYNRTATGHYPVQSVVSNVATGTLNNSASESITLKGFNLNGATVTVTDGGAVTNNVPGQISFSAAALKSKVLDAKVNDIPLMNNLNDNNASGSYQGTVSDSSDDYDELYTYAYNRVPNGDNNNRLTDDIIFDVWEFNDRVAVPKTSTLGGTTMKVNSNNNLIQYAFANGTSLNTPAYYNTNNYSSIRWVQSYDTFQDTGVGMTIDEDGKIFVCGQSSDTNRSLSSDHFSMFTDRWGIGTLNNGGNLWGSNRLSLEKAGEQDTNGNLELRKKRIQSPSFAASTGGKVYLAYYDSINDEIRFRGGKAGNNAGTFGMFGHNYASSEQNVAYNLYNAQILADGTDAMANKSRGAGAYVSLAVTPMLGNGNSANDTVISVWYDNDANRLRYSYIENPLGNLADITNNKEANKWSDVKTLFETVGGGKYCQVAVDAAGGVHVAAYVGSGQLYYAYAENYQGSFTEVCVDEVDLVGQNLTLDAALDSEGNAVPYIGYYSSKDKAKYAHPVTAANKTENGSENGFYTGKWETTIVPSASILYVKAADKINVGVWKYTDTTTGANAHRKGQIKNSYSTGTTVGTSLYNTENDNGKTYGNGTSNAVLVYQIVDSTGKKVNCIESAQMRGSD